MKLFFGTGNGNKVGEFRETLDDGFEVVQVDRDVLEPQLESVEEISRYKLERLLGKTDLDGEWVFVEDSGLFVDELDGFPGAFTSAFTGSVDRGKLLRLIDEDYSAVFKTSVAIRNPDKGSVDTLVGRCEGKLVEARGSEGWGYDPYFVPEGSDKTFSEDMDYKEEVSHRKRAVKKLNGYLSDHV